MNLPDLKQLDKVIALCRKRGVKSIKIDNIELILSEDSPVSPYKKAKQAASITSDNTKIDTQDALSPEELLFWSTGLNNESLDETSSG